MRWIMKKNWYVPALLALTLFTLALPVSAASADRYRFRGQNVSAEWESFNGCLETFTYVFAAESQTHDAPGAPSTTAGVSVGVSVYDYCAGENLLSAFGSATLPEGTRLISGGLQSATIQATVQAYDYISGATVPVTVDLHWEGQGEITRSTNRSNYQSSGYRYSLSSSGTSRPASVTGDVTVAGVSYTSPESLFYAALSQSQYGSIFILR